MTLQHTAVEACEALCIAYGERADAGDADGLAALFTEDARLDRLGQVFQGRDGIRSIIASRPAGVWSRHIFSNIRVEIGVDGRSASGSVDLAMERGRQGQAEVEQVRATYADRYRLTEAGWKFCERKISLVA